MPEAPKSLRWVTYGLNRGYSMINVVDVDMYHVSVTFLIESDIHEFNMLYYDNASKITDEEYRYMLEDIKNPERCNGFTIALDSGAIMVFIRHAYLEEDVAHEIFHAANRILYKRGFELDEGGEAWAYLIGYLTRKYYESIEEYNKNNGKTDT